MYDTQALDQERAIETLGNLSINVSGNAAALMNMLRNPHLQKEMHARAIRETVQHIERDLEGISILVDQIDQARHRDAILASHIHQVPGEN